MRDQVSRVARGWLLRRVGGIFQAPPALVREVSQWAVGRWAASLLPGIDSLIEKTEERARGEGPRAARARERLDELKKVRREAQEAAREGDDRKSFEVSLDGWRHADRYRDALEGMSATGRKTLDLLEHGKVDVVLKDLADRREGERGSYSPGSGRMVLNVLPGASSVSSIEDFERARDEIGRIVRHESQHVGQDMLEAVTGAQAGRPTRKVRKKGPDRDRPHHLRDEELHTRMADEAHRITKATKGMSGPVRDLFVKVWTGAVSPPADGEDEVAFADRHRVPRDDREGLDRMVGQPSEFFRDLKRDDPDRWREAASKVHGAVARDGGSWAAFLRERFGPEGERAGIRNPETGRSVQVRTRMRQDPNFERSLRREYRRWRGRG